MAMRLNPNLRYSGVRKSFGLSGDALKVLGAFLTLQATVGVAMIGRSLLHLEAVADQAGAELLMDQGVASAVVFVMLCRMGGAGAWLIFALMGVTGFRHTENPRRYLLRVGITALVSEVPYDICTYGTWFSFQSQNPLISLFLGLMVLHLMEDVFAPTTANKVMAIIGGLLWTVLLVPQNGSMIFLSMVAFYYLEERELLRNVLIAAISLLDVLYVGPWVGLITTTLPVLVGLFVIHWYREEAEPRLPKWLFYAAYPLHLVIFAVLCMTTLKV